MALVFDISALADMMSIGTLVAYTLVAASVLVLRYKEEEDKENDAERRATIEHTVESEDASLLVRRPSTSLLSDDSLCASRDTGGRFLLWGMRPYAAASTALMVFTAGSGMASAVAVALSNGWAPTSFVTALAYVFAAIGGAAALAACVVLARIPSGVPKNVDFVVPFCPWVPLLAVLINVYLLASLDPLTWVRFVVWCAIGCAIYFGYGINHSKAGDSPS
jgi:hypothetical protein